MLTIQYSSTHIRHCACPKRQPWSAAAAATAAAAENIASLLLLDLVVHRWTLGNMV